MKNIYTYTVGFFFTEPFYFKPKLDSQVQGSVTFLGIEIMKSPVL